MSFYSDTQVGVVFVVTPVDVNGKMKNWERWVDMKVVFFCGKDSTKTYTLEGMSSGIVTNKEKRQKR